MMRSETIKGIKDQSQFTVVVLGDAKTGKTAFVTQCILDKMKTTYKPTIEDCYTTLARLPDGKYKTVDMIDTAGSMEFPAMRELRIRSATLVVMVYDVDNPDSINKINALTKQVRQIREYDEVPIIVIGNMRSTTIKAKSKAEALPLPALLASGQEYEHFYVDVSDSNKCKQVYDRIIVKCYENSTWKVEVWAMPPKRSSTDSSIEKKRGLLSYLSFRKSKSKSGHRQTPSKMTRSSKSIL